MRTANYKPKANENHLVHVQFTKIMPEGQRTKDVLSYQMFHPREYDKMKASIDKFGLKGITQYHEMEVVHDPRSAKVEPEVDESEKEDIKAFLTANGISFDSRLGLKKLKALKTDYESLKEE